MPTTQSNKGNTGSAGLAPKSPPKQTLRGCKCATSALEMDKGVKKKRMEKEEGAENDPKKGK